jgi:polyisoprenoid-binding protein YceI
MKPGRLISALLLGAAFSPAFAAPVEYKIDPDHTFPSFEGDHMGISVWRGKFNKNSGKVTLDKEKGQGTVEVAIDLASVDFGHQALNAWARSADFFDIEKHPQAIFKGRLEGFAGGAPTQAAGTLNLHGVTKPVTLKIHSFKCIPHPLFKREVCGADVSGTINRDEFGLDAGKTYGFRMDTTLRIQVEALATQ